MQAPDPDARPPRPWWVAVLILQALTVLALTTLGAPSTPGAGNALLVLLIATTALTVVAGLLSLRTQRAFQHRLAESSASRAAQEERLRLARDLHDLVSHGLGMITVRVAAARRLGPDGDAEQRAALHDVEVLSRSMTDELRHVLTVLRDPDADPPLLPSASQTLAELIAGARRSGLRVSADEVTLDGLEPAASGTVLAVVREGLANAARHAGPTAVRVGLDRTPEGLRVTVADDGPTPGWQSTPGAGQGLPGLRERVAPRGSVRLEPGAGGGHRLVAILPEEPS